MAEKKTSGAAQAAASSTMDIEKLKADAMAEIKAEVDAEIKDMLENAKTEAEQIIAAAKETAAPKKRQTKAEKEAEAYWNEKVEIRLFKDNDKYKDDVFVGHNGVGYLIRRGESVKVPRFVADILRNQEEQDKRTSDLMQQLQDDFKKAEAAIEAKTR